MRQSVLLICLGIVCAPVAAGQPVKLTLQEAEALALKNHPQVMAAQHMASAVAQEVIEAKAPYYPVVAGDVTASGANQQARLGAGAISTSRLFERFGDGININQLVSDFGRTPNLIASARLHANAALQTVQATRYDIVLAVDQAYFDVLRAQQTIRVATQTVSTRQTALDQVAALAKNNLRSDLDVTFVDVSLAQAKMLLIQAKDFQQQAFAQLTRAIGAQQNAAYDLTEQPLPPEPPADPEPFIAQALAGRPEVVGLRMDRDSAYRFERAERDLKLPTVSLVAVGGYIPYIDQITLPRVVPNEYGGAAVDIHIPVFNGHLYTARQQEAHFRALEADQRVRDQEQAIARDVRTAWASASTAYQRMAVTAQMLQSATQSLKLAQGRYQLGLDSVVELTQAQLNLTQAEIDDLTAKYDYQSQNAALQFTLGALR